MNKATASPTVDDVFMEDGPVELNAKDKNDDILLINMKRQLGLDKLRCACPTSEGTRCTLEIVSSKIAEVEALLKSLSHLTQESQDLPKELEELARLVHCYRHHNLNRYRVKRVKSWKKTFPGLPDIPTMDEKIQDLFKLSRYCCGFKNDGRRCTEKLGGQKVLDAGKTVSELVNPEIYLDDGNREYALQVLATNTICDKYDKHIEQCEDRVEAWNSRIVDINSSWPNTSAKLRRESRRKSWILQSRCENIPPGNCWPVARDMSRLITEIKPDRPETPQDAYKFARKTLLSPFRDQNSGYIYIYQVDNNEGLIKIGHTQDVRKRVKQWESYCNRAATLIYATSTGIPGLVPHAKRVEALCHAELEYRNEVVSCHACTVDHKEWFRVPPSEAIAVVEKWCAWMKTNPYEQLTKTEKIEEEQFNTFTEMNPILGLEKQTEDMDTFMYTVLDHALKTILRTLYDLDL